MNNCTYCDAGHRYRYQLALHLYDAHRQSEAEIATLMDYAPQSVKPLLTKARQRRLVEQMAAEEKRRR